MDHEDGDGDGDGDGAGLGDGVDGETPEGGSRRPPEVIPAVFPPSDLLRRQPSVSLFLVLCFSTAPPGKHQGTIFIVIFRSRGCFRAKDRRKRGHEG